MLSRNNRSRILVALALAAALPISVVQAVPAFAKPHRPTAGLVRPAPVQRTGSTAGLPHLIGQNGNRMVPQSLRSRYPVTEPGVVAAPAEPARVLAAAAGQPPGFQPGSSVEQPGRRGRFSQTYANPDGTDTTVLSTDPVNYQAGDGSWQPIKPRLARTGAGDLTSAGGAEPLRLARPVG